MKQYEAVIIALEKMGEQATLANLYRETMKVKKFTMRTTIYIYLAYPPDDKSSGPSQKDVKAP